MQAGQETVNFEAEDGSGWLRFGGGGFFDEEGVKVGGGERRGGEGVGESKIL